MKFKKVLAAVLAATMIMGMSVTTFAASAMPTKDDAAKVTISEIEEGSTLSAYQIIDASYDDYGFTGYVWAEGMQDAGKKVQNPMTEITDKMITELAKNPSLLTQFDGNPDEEGCQFNPDTDKLTVGTWMILVTPPEKDPAKTYNPMIVSVYYDVKQSGDMNVAIGGSVSATDNWELTSTNAYAKSSEIKITKDVDDAYLEVGKPANFTITGTIPSYSGQYTEAVYKITDEIINGLEYPADFAPEVTVGTTKLTNGKEYDFILAEDRQSFTIAFHSDYILDLADKTLIERGVTVKYSANVTDKAITSFGENKVELEYTNKPGSTSDGKIDKEYVFTFSLDGVLQKVDGDKKNGLAGAEFTLYRSYADGTLSDEFGRYTTKNDDDFDIEFKGLEGDKAYYLKETKAPDGYSINDTVYKIEFVNIKTIKDDNNKDIVTAYDVKVTNADTGEAVTNITINYGDEATNFGEQIVNTKLSELPSTGGIGTTIFTIGGCVIMIAAAGLYFASRRRQENK